LILCGTISGFMDPFAWFGIHGGLLSGKVAALAVYDPQTAQSEFDRFNKNFKMVHFFKSHIWTRMRPKVNMFEKPISLIGASRLDSIISKMTRRFNPYGTNPLPFPYTVTRQDVQNLRKTASKPGRCQ